MGSIEEGSGPERRPLTALEMAGVFGIILPTAIPTLVVGWFLERRHEWNARVRHGLSAGALSLSLLLLAMSYAWQFGALAELWDSLFESNPWEGVAATLRGWCR
jgi:hypothetical protein